MNLLVSGANGFVSKSILSYLKNNSNFINKLGLVSSSANRISLMDKFNINNESIGFENFINNNFKTSYDVYVHGISEPMSSHNRYKINFINLKKSLNSCLSKNIKTFVYLSSGAVYQKKGSTFDESDLTVSLTNIRNTYADAKLREEVEVKKFCENNKINFIILRLFSFAGYLIIKRNEFAIIDLFNNAVSNGVAVVKSPKVVRSYMHEYDLGGAIINIISNTDAMNECINIGSPESISMGELGLKISKITSANLLLEKSDYKDFYVPNISKQKKFYKQKLKDINFIIQDLYSKFNETII